MCLKRSYYLTVSQSGEPKVVQSLTDVYVSEPGSPHFDTAWGDATVTHPSTFSKVVSILIFQILARGVCECGDTKDIRK